MIYFDNAATTYPKPECMYEAMDYAQRNLAFNAGRGSYRKSKEAHDAIEECRRFLCEKANAKSLIFTPSATHSLNMVTAGLSFDKDDIIYCSPYDHNAIVRTLYENARKYSFTIKQIPLNDDLSIDIDSFKIACMKDKPKAIYCTHVSNVTGYILPIDKIGEIASKFNSLFIVDGAQAFGLVPVDLQDNSIDYYIFAGHKTLYGPFGIAGILCKDENIKLEGSFYGGTGSDSLNVYMPVKGIIKYEPSSPNVVSIYSLYQSARWAFSNNLLQYEIDLAHYFIKKLSNINDVEVYTNLSDNFIGIVSFNIKGMYSNDVAKILEDYEIMVRSDYHCSPFIHDVLKSKKYLGTVRVSFSYFNKRSEIDLLIDAIEEIILE